MKEIVFVTRNKGKLALAQMTEEEREGTKEQSTSSLKQFSDWYISNL